MGVLIGVRKRGDMRRFFHLICKKLLELLEDLPDKGDIQKILEERAKKLLEEPEGQNHGGKS